MEADIEQALRTIQAGGLILYPTDTIWGIGCDASNAAAVERVFQLKKRADSKSLVVLMSDIDMLSEYVAEIPSAAQTLMQSSPRPLTLIYPHAKGLASAVMGSDETLAVRIPKDAFCLQLIQSFRKPIVSTSANISGESAPAFFSAISKEIIDGVNYVVQHRQTETEPGEASVIIRLLPDGGTEIIRK